MRLQVYLRAERVVFGVIDTGIGIPADRMAELFNNFEQVDASPTRRFGGSGLGLAISRRLATLMGAEIEVSSKMGVGSRFRLIAPLRRVGGEEAAETGAAPATSFREPGALRVLAAEDNSVNQLVLRTLLQ